MSTRRWTAGWAVATFAAALVVYLVTLAPTLTWAHDGADGGDLITATWVLGVPHPPGYPTYVLLGRIFLLWPWGDPAYRLNLMSAVAAAGAVALTYLLALEAIAPPGAATFRFAPWAARQGRQGRQGRLWREHVLAGAAASTFAFSPLFWSQAIIAEVYALNALFVALVAYLLLRWQRGGERWLPLAALVLGLGLGNHLTLAFVVPIALTGLVSRISACSRRDAKRVGAWFGVAFLCFLAGLTVYLYLPWSAAHDPPVNWGDPRTVERFWWVVSGAVYRGYLFGVPLYHVPSRLTATVGLGLQQFGWWGMAIGLVGLWWLWQRRRGLAVVTAAGIALYAAYAVGYDTPSSYLYLIPAFLACAVWLAAGLHAATCTLARGRWAQLWVLALALPALSLILNFADVDLHADREAYDYGQAVLTTVAPQAIVLTGTDEHTFALWYARYVTVTRSDVAIIDRDLLAYDWYRVSLARHQPDLEMHNAKSDAMLIEANLSRHAIYLTDLPGPAGYEFRPAGPVWRVEPPAAREGP